MRRRPFCSTISAVAGDLQAGWGHPSVPGLVGLWWWEEAAWTGRLRCSSLANRCCAEPCSYGRVSKLFCCFRSPSVSPAQEVILVLTHLKAFQHRDVESIRVILTQNQRKLSQNHSLWEETRTSRGGLCLWRGPRYAPQPGQSFPGAGCWP